VQRVNQSNQRGAAAVEFAIILPLLILLIFGTIEFSLLLFNKQVITNAAREGARKAVILKSPRESNEEIEKAVNKYKSQLVSFDPANSLDIDICPDYESPTTCPRDGGSVTLSARKDADSGTDVYVTVTYDYSFLVLANLGFDPVNIEAVSVMRME
jgi:Flp pilus assembly protein TadG